MGEYLSPGVYIEEVEMGAKPIQGVSTSTVGFVGKGFNMKTINKAITDDLVKFESFKDDEAAKTVLNELSAEIKAAKDKEKIDALVAKFETLKNKIKKTDKDLNKINKYFLILEEKISKLKIMIENLNKPIFISSWSDYKNKFGINSNSDDISSEGYLAPAVYSFFINGGTRCYVVSTSGTDKTSIIGSDTNGVRTGLTAFEEVDEVKIICAPGISDTSVHLALIAHCEKMKNRFAILDPAAKTSFDNIQSQTSNVSSDSGIAALYYPWIQVAVEVETDDNKINLKNSMLPPSGAVAGVFARSDNERGVHKAPANEVLRGVSSLEKTITTAEQDILNPKNINCIRFFSGTGIRIWGARTLSSDPLWKYVNIRRLFLYLEESIEQSTQWVVFEPNNEQLWARVEQTINNFLIGVWKSGALMGTSPDEAFFVQCNKTTMTNDDINNGRLIINIGVAPTKPAEFVIFRIAQLTASANS